MPSEHYEKHIWKWRDGALRANLVTKQKHSLMVWDIYATCCSFTVTFNHDISKLQKASLLIPQLHTDSWFGKRHDITPTVN